MDLENARLFGTLHYNDTYDERNPKPGLLLFGFGQQPRSWVGDLGARIADRIAGLGFLVFRFDMPGLGDSPGDLPIHLEILWREIQLGAHEPYLHALSIRLQKEYPVNGLVIGGFCGGAVTATYAVNSNSIDLKGFVLIEPEFSLAKIETDQKKNVISQDLTIRSYLSRRRKFARKIFSVTSWKNLLTGKADVKFWLNYFKNVWDRLLRKLFGKKALPPEANTRLYEAWKRARKRSVPTLILSMDSTIRNTYYKEYGLSPGQDQPASNLSWIEIPNTTHAMLAGGAKEAVCVHITKWFTEHYS